METLNEQYKQKEKQILESTKYKDYVDEEVLQIFEFIVKVTSFIANNSKTPKRTYGDWQVGITNDLNKRLSAHGSPTVVGKWDCGTDKVARKVECYFTQFRKTKGDQGGGGDDAKYLYAFAIDSLQKPKVIKS